MFIVAELMLGPGLSGIDDIGLSQLIGRLFTLGYSSGACHEKRRGSRETTLQWILDCYPLQMIFCSKRAIRQHHFTIVNSFHCNL